MRAARSSVVALATAALVSGGWGLAGLSFAAGVARARYLSVLTREFPGASVRAT
jgi:lambda repressor-like predicted transcriptional regulator